MLSGEGSILSDMDTASWAQALRRTQSRAAFQRLELEGLIQSMRAQVFPGTACCILQQTALHAHIGICDIEDAGQSMQSMPMWVAG